MKYPAGLFEPDGTVVSFGELRSWLRAVRYDSARRWAKRRSREELEHAVAALIARRHPYAGIETQRERRSKILLMQRSQEERAARDAHYRQRPKIVGQMGGSATAAVTADIRAYAVGLAKQQEPAGGWKSAPDAARAIMADVEAYARSKGRRYAYRKVEEWLRVAGIKRERTC